MEIDFQSLLKLVFMVSSCLGQSLIYQKNTMNEEDKIFRKTYILNYMETVVLLYYGLPEFFYQPMHYLLDTQNVKIYIKILYNRSYMFRSPMTIIRELFTEPG